MTGVLTKGGNLDTDMHTGRTPCEDEGRDGGNGSASQEMLKIASKKSQARREAKNRFPLTALRRDQPCRHLDLGLPASRTVRQ